MPVAILLLAQRAGSIDQSPLPLPVSPRDRALSTLWLQIGSRCDQDQDDANRLTKLGELEDCSTATHAKKTHAMFVIIADVALDAVSD